MLAPRACNRRFVLAVPGDEDLQLKLMCRGSGLGQLFREQLRFHGETATPLEIPFGDGRFRLVHELFDLAHHILLARIELASFDFLQIFFGRGSQLLGREALLRGLLFGCVMSEFNRRLI